MAHPPDDLPEVTPPTAEDKEMSGKGVLLQDGLCLRRQGRKALPHVGDTRRQPDPRLGRDRDHAVRPRISRANA